MTRNDFIRRVAEKGKEVYGKRFYYTDIEKYLGLILETLGDVMAEGENVVLWKFGAFKSAQTKEKQRKGQILRSTPNTAPLICGAYNTQPEGLSTMA